MEKDPSLFAFPPQYILSRDGNTPPPPKPKCGKGPPQKDRDQLEVYNFLYAPKPPARPPPIAWPCRLCIFSVTFFKKLIRYFRP